MSQEFMFHPHPEIKDNAHALISPSRHIIREDYTDEQFDNYIRSSYATSIGTSIHELAADIVKSRMRINDKEARKLIEYKLWKDRIPRNVFNAANYIPTFVPYVKDAIGFDMSVEQVLKYSDYAFGTADAIKYNPVKGTLRIHDLKTGKTPAPLDQLLAYAALFFLEYHVKPGDVEVTLCIYQNGEILTGEPKTPDILPIMNKIISMDKYYQRHFREV